MARQPAKADQSQLDQIDKQESDQKDQAQQKADAQEQQIAAQLEAQGVPPAQAQCRRRRRSSRGSTRSTKQIEQQADDQRKKADQPATDPRLQDLRDDLQKTSGVATVTAAARQRPGHRGVLTVTPTTAPSDRATEQLVRRLRDDTIPAATKGQGMTADVGGTTAGYVDLADEISGRLVLTIGVVVALSFLLLLLAFRSVVIPLTAGVMNLISIGAAFGVVDRGVREGLGRERSSASTARSRS